MKLKKELGAGTLSIGKGVLSKRNIAVIVLLLMALLSATVLGSLTSSTDFHASTFATLDEQKKNVTLLMVSASTTSAVISAFPDDTCTPIAEELSDLSTYFLLALSVLYAEKFLLTTIGYVVFTWIVPISLLLIVWYLFSPKRRQIYSIAVRILAFGLALYFVIPLSAKICNNIQQTYQATIQETIDLATQSEEEAEESTQDSEEEDKGFWGNLGDSISDIADSVTGAFSSTVEWAKTVLNRFVEAVAVMLVTSCIIPLVVLLCLMKVAKVLFGSGVKMVYEHQYFEALDKGTDE